MRTDIARRVLPEGPGPPFKDEHRQGDFQGQQPRRQFSRENAPAKGQDGKTFKGSMTFNNPQAK